MDEGQAHFALGLRLGGDVEQPPQGARHRQPPKVDLLELIEALRVLGQPLETRPEENGVLPMRAPAPEEIGRGHRLDRPPGKRRAGPQHAKRGSATQERERSAETAETRGDPCGVRAHRGGCDDPAPCKGPGERGVCLECGTPEHLVLAQEHRDRRVSL